MPAEKNRKFFDLRNGLKAVDFRNKDYFDRIDDKEKSLYSPYMLMRYVSNVSSKDPFYIEHYIEMVNECVNKHCFTLGKHKKLLWILTAMCGAETTTIPSMDQTNEACTKQESKETTTDIPNMEGSRPRDIGQNNNR